MKKHLLWQNEWIKLQNCINKDFNVCAPCDKCGKAYCGLVWYSIKSKIVYCIKCFDPRGIKIGV